MRIRLFDFFYAITTIVPKAREINIRIIVLKSLTQEVEKQDF